MLKHIEKLNNYNDKVLVNWSKLPRRYEVKNTSCELAKNGGQIIKQYLTKEGINVQKFEIRKSCSESGQMRKKIKQGAGGENYYTMPIDKVSHAHCQAKGKAETGNCVKNIQHWGDHCPSKSKSIIHFMPALGKCAH